MHETALNVQQVSITAENQASIAEKLNETINRFKI
jgi:methyl-accepting chemotaxis protein